MTSNDSSSIKVPHSQTPSVFLFGCDRQHMLRRLIMDEESKKIIAGLCESVKAIQAEIKTLKDIRESEAKHSGSNTQAGSQNSNLVPGSGPAPNKRRKTVSEGASEEDEEKEDDPEEFVDLRRSKDSVPMSEAARVNYRFSSTRQLPRSKLDIKTKSYCTMM